MSQNKWTRNQKILLSGVIIAILGLAANSYFLYKTSGQQILINQDLNEIKGKIGEFDQLISNDLFVNNINFTCPQGTEINSSFWKGDGQMGVNCVNISSE